MTTMVDPATRSRLAPEIEALADQFEGTFGIGTIERYLAVSLDQFDNVKVRRSCPSSSVASPASGSGPSPSPLEPS